MIHFFKTSMAKRHRFIGFLPVLNETVQKFIGESVVEVVQKWQEACKPISAENESPNTSAT